MFYGTKSLNEKENSIQEFTVQFAANMLVIDGSSFPIGQISNDVLNLPEATPTLIYEKFVTLSTAVREQLFNPNIEKTISLVTSVQEKLNEVIDIVLKLPLYRNLDLDKDKTHNILLIPYREFPEEFSKMVTIGTEENYVLVSFFEKLKTIADEIITFKTYVGILLDFYFEKLSKRNSEYYAVAVYDFFSNTTLINEIAEQLPPHPTFEFRQSRGALIEYTTMPNPENTKEYIIAERMVFNLIGAFLHVDFFRGLMNGNAPRRCHNCERYFLLTEGYNICYCNNIAPGEAKRTCRKVGPHRKEAKKEGKTPIQIEYYKVYNRLKTRKSRGTLSVDDWNKLVSKAQDYKEKAEQGMISEFELKRLFKEM